MSVTAAEATQQPAGKSRYTIRKPFAVHLAWFDTVTDDTGKKRKTRREQSYMHGMGPIELSDEDAIDHMHKLEPVDDGAKKLFKTYHDKQTEAVAARQAQDGNVKPLAAQVSEAVVQALVAAGVIKAKATA